MSEMVVGTSALNVQPSEELLSQEVSIYEQQAEAIIITDPASMEAAGDFARQIKRMQSTVKDYWEPLRVSTKAAYDNVLAQKKEMIGPLEKAEKTVKDKMTAYSDEERRKKAEQEEMLRRMAKEEVDRKLQEAAEAEKAGDTEGAAYHMAEAEMAESAPIQAPAEDQKIKGVSRAKAWKIISIDESKVPVEIAGAVIRPVDEKAIKQLIKDTKGNVKIPGVQYEETTSISIRK